MSTAEVARLQRQLDEANTRIAQQDRVLLIHPNVELFMIRRLPRRRLSEARRRSILPATLRKPAAMGTSEAQARGWGKAFADTIEEDLYQRIKQRLIDEAPAIIQSIVLKPEVQIVVERRTVSFEAGSLKGRIIKLWNKGHFDQPVSANATKNELERTGRTLHPTNLKRALQELRDDGLLTEEPNGWQRNPDCDVTVNEAA